MFDDAQMWNDFWRWQPPDEAHYVIVGGRVTLARSSDQTRAFISLAK